MLKDFLSRINLTIETQNRLFIFLIIVAIACLGALPIAPLLLARLHPSASPKTRAATLYTEGECTGPSKYMFYAPTSEASKSFPSIWAKSKNKGTKQDYINALACASTFIETYESFDYHQVQSLYTAIPMLSAQAKRRFYEGDGSTSANARTSTAWQSKIKRDHIIQVTTANLTTVADVAVTEGVIYVTLRVPYRTIEQINGQTTIQNLTAVVLLKEVTPDSRPQGTGWQIFDWHDNA